MTLLTIHIIAGSVGILTGFVALFAVKYLVITSHIPQPIRIVPLLLVPPLVVVVTMLYWLWRVRFKKSLRGIVRVGAVEIVRALSCDFPEVLP